MITPNGFHVEMHFSLIHDAGPATAILDDVWNRCSRVPGTDHEYRMDDDIFYLFHMAHAAKHFRGGGCGVRPVLDTWFLNHHIDYDPEKRKKLLQQAGLLTFAETIELIAEAWFSGAKTEGISDVEDYILTGGVYGGEQRVAAGQARKNGRLTYLISRACPPIDTLKYKYPVLEKCPLLLPFCWIHRLVSGVLKGKGQLAKYEIAKTKEEAEHSTEIAEMFKRLGLS